MAAHCTRKLISVLLSLSSGTIGQGGPLLGTRLFPKSEGPYYRKGAWVSAGCLLFGLVIACIEVIYLNRLNKRKGPIPDDGTSEEERQRDIAQHGTSSTYFRYTI